MDRKGSISKRPSSKTKAHLPPGDFFPLGSKARSGSEPDLKSLNTPSSSRTSKLIPTPPSGGLKRESSSSSIGSLTSKKPKISGPTFTPLGRPEPDVFRKASPTPTPLAPHEEIAREVDPCELLDAIQEAEDCLDDEKVEQLLCGAVRYLRTNRAKPEPSLFLTLMYLAKTKSMLFTVSETVTEAFCSLLKRDMSLNFKAKGNPLVSVLACNILMIAHEDEKHWPSQFMKVYLEDSLGERVWIDRADCKSFVDNIQTAFGTNMPRQSMILEQAAQPTLSAGSSPLRLGDDDDGSRALEALDGFDKAMFSIGDNDDPSMNVMPRYTYQEVAIETQVMEMLQEQLTRRQSMDGASRNLVRVFTATCGYSEVRLLAAQRLEMWLQNPKLTRAAQDLLMAVCMNCSDHSQSDIEVMNLLSKIRLKTKPLVNHYLLAIRELLLQHKLNMHTLMNHTIYNELSNSRNPNNMMLLSVMFQQSSAKAAKILAEIFQELLCNREDYLRALRVLLREIVRSVRSDMNFEEFALGLMKKRTDSKFTDIDAQLKDRLLLSIADLITLTTLLSVSPSVKEAASAYSRGDHRDKDQLQRFHGQVSTIQRDSVWWLHTVVPQMFEIKPADFNFCLRKVLFVEKSEHYTKLDGWPPEGDRGILLRLVSDVPVKEDTLMRVMVIGLTKDFGVSAADALELADQLIRRAAINNAPGYDVLRVEKLKLFDAVFNLCAYRHPENIVLPKGYTPPMLAISTLYWKAWVMLLIIAAFNPAVFGLTAWENYPTLKCFMEMVMTNNYKYPPPTMAPDEKTAEEIRAHERQMCETEKEAIIEFESHLAAATSKVAITEANSLLLSQLTTIDPAGVCRRPPATVLEQLRSLNSQLQLGAMLCRSRNPDFLLDIIQRQGTSQSMRWLAELVESSEGSLDVLPVQCLCEFLLHDSPESPLAPVDDDLTDKQKRKHKEQKQEQLLARLQSLLHRPDSDAAVISEVLNYFLKRLASQQTSQRQLAVKGLSLVLSKSHISQDEDDLDMMEVEDNPAVTVLPGYVWLLKQLITLPQFETVRSQVSNILRQACQVETDAVAVSAYIIFLSQNLGDMPQQELDDLLLDMAKLIVERPTLINHILPQEDTHDERLDLVLCSMVDMFFSYLKKAQQPNESYVWSNAQDQILLQWEAGESATMNILVVHAMIILLTYSKPEGKSNYGALLDTWFPEVGHSPTAYLVDTSEEALLFPDWLKLRMIRSCNTRLVESALQDLEPGQLLLFVQSFGIPVWSMTQLLACLDRAVDTDGPTMESAVVDKGYMAQLVEVQHMRGATGGHRFHALLTRDLPPPPKPGDPIPDPPHSRMRRSLSVVARAPGLDTSQTSTDQVSEMLLKMFGVKGSVSSSERQQMYRTLMKGLAKDKKLCGAAVTAMLKILRAQQGKKFLKGIRENQNLACALLKVLVAKQPVSTMMTEVLESVYGSLCLPAHASAPSKLQTFLVGHLMKKQNLTHSRHVHEHIQSRKKDTKDPEDHFTKVVMESCATHDAHQERTVNMCIYRSLSNCKADERTRTICKMLMERDLPQSAIGLLVDWLALLDPDLVATCPDLQQVLLFAQDKPGTPSRPEPGICDGAPSISATPVCTSTRPTCQPYLLALLTQQTSWSSLLNCIRVLLQQQPNEQRFNPTSVLDFLSACIHIPKIWRGRDKKLPKNYIPEDVLCLTGDQIRTVVDYVIEEALQLTAGSHQLSAAAAERIDQRMSLLILSCCNHGNLIRAAVDHAHDRLKAHGSDWGVCHHLLLQLYLRLPRVLGLCDLDSRTLAAENSSAPLEGIGLLDGVTHRVLTTLGNATPGKACEARMFDANIAARKLATHHPIILLRQLPMVAALLQGRAQVTWGELRHRNHYLLYNHVLGLLELLQPYIFNRQYDQSLQDTLEAYFQLLKIHGVGGRQLAPVISKLVQFLHNLMSADSARAGRILHKYVPLLNILSSHFPDFPVLKSLLAGLALPRQMSAETSGEGSIRDDSDGGMLLEVTSLRPRSPWTVNQLAPFHQRISKQAPIEDVIDVLKDLDETSKRKVDILEHFVGDLKRLMSHSQDVIRNTAHLIIMRYIRQYPGSAGNFVSAFLQCLDSDNQDVIRSGLKNLPEFVLLAQESAVTILLKAFNVGVSSKVDTSAAVGEALQLLNLDSMQ